MALTPKQIKEINVIINKNLDFRRDNEYGHMLTDCDIISGIVMFTEEIIDFDEAELLFDKEVEARKNRVKKVK